jgi:hypothetical protein
MNTRYAAAVALSLSIICACALPRRAPPSLSPATMAQLWREPVDLEQRDLFSGPGGAKYAPAARDRFEFLEIKSSGVNPGYDVTDSQGQRWSVKLGAESRTEVVVSRVLWAVGYHQPLIYHVPQWTLVRDGKDSLLSRARFRLEPAFQNKTGEWSWRRNAFIGTRELAGLYVLMVLFNNWDLKTAQNAIYEVTEDGKEPERWYMVRDLGASLGRSAWLTFGTKDNPDDFDRERFIDGVEGNRVRFAFEGGWLEPHLHSSVTPDDVRWICGLLSRISAKQWSDAFRAAGYSERDAQPFIRRMREKLAEGLRAGIL